MTLACVQVHVTELPGSKFAESLEGGFCVPFSAANADAVRAQPGAIASLTTVPVSGVSVLVFFATSVNVAVPPLISCGVEVVFVIEIPGWYTVTNAVPVAEIVGPVGG